MNTGQYACFQTQDRSLGKSIRPTETKAVPEKKSRGIIALRYERDVSERAYSSERVDEGAAVGRTCIRLMGGSCR